MRTAPNIAFIQTKPRERFEGEKASSSAERALCMMERGEKGTGIGEGDVGFMGIEGRGGEVTED